MVNGPVALVSLVAPAGTVQSNAVLGSVAQVSLVALEGAVSASAIVRTGEGLTLTLVDTSVAQQPGTLRVQLSNGEAGGSAYVFLDGAAVSVISTVLEGSGAGIIGVPINGVAIGTHEVRVGATTTLPTLTAQNSKTFSVTGAPAPAPTPPTTQTPPAPPVVPINRWVFQAYDFSSLVSVNTYTLPVNPNSYSPMYGYEALSSEPTTVSSGIVMTWEGVGQPLLMEWSGVVLTKADHASMLAVGITGQRLYLTDHFRRRFLVKIERLQYGRVRDPDRPWHHSYQASAYVLAEEVLV